MESFREDQLRMVARSGSGREPCLFFLWNLCLKYLPGWAYFSGNSHGEVLFLMNFRNLVKFWIFHSWWYSVCSNFLGSDTFSADMKTKWCTHLAWFIFVWMIMQNWSLLPYRTHIRKKGLIMVGANTDATHLRYRGHCLCGSNTSLPICLKCCMCKKFEIAQKIIISLRVPLR